MKKPERFSEILPVNERYCMPGLNEVRFIGDRQTMSIVMGSCVSTVFVGRNEDGYALAANHIVIASPRWESVVATKTAAEQIEDILTIYKNAYDIDANSICCIHLIGAGHKNSGTNFAVPAINISTSKDILNECGIPLVFEDTGSYFFGTYSIHGEQLSVFIEDKIKERHKSYILDLNVLFDLLFLNNDFGKNLHASVLAGVNPGFEFLVANNAITFITGERYTAFEEIVEYA
jgi:chemotaxis receptor (MCP) glutamine deamidase CheD